MNRLTLHSVVWLSLAVAFSLVAALSPAPAFGQRNLKEIPDPDPELERKTFVVPEGFEVTLWAADPRMAKPIQMNWDERGRLWVASSEVYPHIKPGQAPTDKILVLEDADHDGKADKTTVFADGLLIPTGVAPGDGGVYVANSTELIHLTDGDGDGKADRRQVVLSGFGTEDTHHLLHTLRWGHDGCLYMNQSIYIHSHVETPHGVKRLNGGGIWRFRPETLELDVVCTGFVNSWGHHFDRWGTNFATDGAYGEGINYVFPGAVYVTAPGAKRTLAGLNPGSPKHCGLEIASGRHLPADWEGSMLTNDFRAHRVCRFVVSEDGSGFSSRQEVEVIKSNHPAFRPIDVKIGPDGAIYVADWYNPIIQHGEVDFRDPRRDHVHGRIWRVSAKERPALRLPNLVDAPIPALLDQLRASEEWVRLQAKLQLKARGADTVLPALGRWLASLDRASPDFEHDRLEALWLHQCLDRVNEPLLRELLGSSDHRSRAAAMRVVSLWAPRLAAGSTLELLRAGVADSHPRVRLEAVRGLAQLGTAEAAGLAASTLDKPFDRFLDFALWRTLRDLEPAWLPAVQEGRFDFGGRVDHLMFAFKAVESPGIVAPMLGLLKQNKLSADRVENALTLIASLGGAKELSAVLALVLDENSTLAPAAKAALMQGLVETTLRRKVQPDGDLMRIAPLMRAPDETLRAAGIRAVGVWKLVKLRSTLVELAKSPDDVATPAGVRRAAIDALASLGGEASVETLDALAAAGAAAGATGAAAPASRVMAINALATLDTIRAAQRAVALLEETPPVAAPADVVAALISQKSGAVSLAGALAKRKLSSDVAKLLLRAVQAAPNPSAELAAAVQRAGELSQAGWKLNPQLLAQLVAEVGASGDPRRGELVYRRKQMQCLKCHAIGGAGGRVGPDMVSIGASAPVDYLVESLVEPTKKVKENYHSKLVVTDQGKVISGIPIRETEKELVLRDAEDRQVTIPRNAIEEVKDGRSLMPDGLVDSLTRAELVDLVRFLSELGKVGGEYTTSPARVVRRWESLAWTKDAHARLNRTSYDTAATHDEAFVWEPAYSLVSGRMPVDGLPTYVVHKGNNPTSFLRFQIDMSTGGEVQLLLDSPLGVSLWIDGKPTPPSNTIAATLATGLHQVTLAIDSGLRTDPVRVELVDAPGSPARGQVVGGK